MALIQLRLKGRFRVSSLGLRGVSGFVRARVLGFGGSGGVEGLGLRGVEIRLSFRARVLGLGGGV